MVIRDCWRCGQIHMQSKIYVEKVAYVNLKLFLRNHTPVLHRDYLEEAEGFRVDL